ncbi:hypothetical protein HPC49_22405 [Pyxidicoccus fallax]|uniref:Uncharacterized protein n=1 Tax=Pyxidicoccus fallax TaxID=394095 RepID=A0A848LNI1_9BACT|nr:hypothetical protein [Pyxidicoccus fallax]NMO19405.1 hypothetical protein [Pyxidicoccus fallax]NPC80966.1 hypothetical protein [Pyxidicoccus fallax]
MAERTPTRGRAAWIRAVARQMKAWADSVLADEALSGPDATHAPTSSNTVAAPSEAASASTPPGQPQGPAGVPARPPSGHPRGSTAAASQARDVSSPGGGHHDGPPEHWLRDIQARQKGPPEDWLDRVRQGAPGLLERSMREAPVPPGPARGAGVARTAVPPSVRPFPPEARPPGPPEPVATRAAGLPRVSSLEFRDASASTRFSRAPRPEERKAAPLPEPEPRASRIPEDVWGLGPETFAAFRPPALASTPASRANEGGAPPRPSWSASSSGSASNPLAPISRSPWSDLPPFSDSPAELPRLPGRRAIPPRSPAEPEALEPEKALPTSGLPRVRLLFLDGDPVSSQVSREPPRHRVSPTDDGAWDGAQSLMRWRPHEAEAPPARPGFPSLEAAPSAAESTPASSAPGTWPELPPEPREERDDTVVELREWERQRRLEREQRGE